MKAGKKTPLCDQLPLRATAQCAFIVYFGGQSMSQFSVK
jgi:hypothetical protein